jgi:predicted HicB family RNase H-like nuclease
MACLTLSGHGRYMTKQSRKTAIPVRVEQRRKTATLNLRIDPSLKEAAEAAAAEDHRSLTSLVEKLLADYLKAKGFAWEQTR